MESSLKINYRLIFYLLLAAFLVVNLATLSDYGMTWDEAAQHHIGQVTLDFLKGKTTDFNFQREDLVYYGPFFETLNYYFSTSLLESFNINYVSAFHVLIVLTAGLGLLFLFWLASAMLGEPIALLACVFLMLLPRWAATRNLTPRISRSRFSFSLFYFSCTPVFFKEKLNILSWPVSFWAWAWPPEWI